MRGRTSDWLAAWLLLLFQCLTAMANAFYMHASDGIGRRGPDSNRFPTVFVRSDIALISSEKSHLQAARMSTGSQLASAVHDRLGIALTHQAACQFLATSTSETALRDDVTKLVAHILAADLHLCGTACLPTGIKVGPLQGCVPERCSVGLLITCYCGDARCAPTSVVAGCRGGTRGHCKAASSCRSTSSATLRRIFAKGLVVSIGRGAGMVARVL